MNHHILVDKKGKIRAEGSLEALKKFSINKDDRILECTSLGNEEVEYEYPEQGWADSDNDLINN